MTLPAFIQVPCHGCDNDVIVLRAEMTLTIGCGVSRYTFNCKTCGPRTQEAHGFIAGNLIRADVQVVEPGTHP